MLLKALVTTPSTAVITLRLDGDTSIANTNLQIVIRGQLQEIVNRLLDNNRLLKEKINGIEMAKIKLLLIKRFIGERSKLRGFLTQIYFKVTQEGAKLVISIDQIVYTGLFLIGKALEQFKPYLTEIQSNGITTTNKDI